MEKFTICGATITHTLIDMDFIIRYYEGDKKRLVSSKNLKALLDEKRGQDLFVKFVSRAYKGGDETICKLRSGIKVSFCYRTFKHESHE